MNFIPTNISRPKPGLLKATWDDGFEAVIKLENFRKECPCADCREKAESKPLMNKFIMPTIKSGQFDLKKLTPVGNYAINAEWVDGHEAGIYTWEYFRELFERFKISDEELLKYENKLINNNDLNIRSN